MAEALSPGDAATCISSCGRVLEERSMRGAYGSTTIRSTTLESAAMLDTRLGSVIRLKPRT